MKKIGLLLLASMLATTWTNQAEAAIVMIGGPGIAISAQQPVQAVVVDANGATYQQTVYYNPAVGGVDLDTSWAGPNVSVYFPEYGTGYLWYNGFWVDQTGYYWDGGRRLYIGHPSWREHWAGHWHCGWHEGWHGGWHGGGHEGWHGRPEVSVHVHESFHGGGYHHHR